MQHYHMDMSNVPAEEIQRLLESGRWPRVILMTVKGNLRHRIEKLGEEEEITNMTEGQRTLRTIAAEQYFEADGLISGHLSRPLWGGGAFFYCDEVVVNLMKDTRRVLPFPLQSKHIVCSPQHEAAVRECLGGFGDGQNPCKHI